MATIDAKTVLERLKPKLSVKTDAELADRLGVPHQTLNSWKKRGSIPLDVVIDAAEKHGVSLDYMFALNHAVEDEDYSYLLFRAAEIAAGESYDEQSATRMTRDEFLSYFLRLRMNFEHQCVKLALRDNIGIKEAIKIVVDDWYKRGVIGRYTERPQPLVLRTGSQMNG